MVTIVDYKTYQKEDGTEFNALVVQGELEMVKSKTTGKYYFTARTAKVPSTLTENACKSLIGTQIQGSIQKVEVKPYEYISPDTGEVQHLTHRYELINEQDAIINDHVIAKEIVA